MDGLEGTAGAEADFADVLRHLRGLALPCFPPVGVGSFDILYASEREVVVWYSPAREEHRTGEVAIPCERLAAAWRSLLGGEPLDEAALERCGEGVAGGRWLLALLAQLPGVRVQPAPLALIWSPPPPPDDHQLSPSPETGSAAIRAKPRKRRAKSNAPLR